MDFDTLLQKIIQLARIQFREEEQDMDEATTAAEITAWNSLSHVMFITAIENTFGIKFDLLQMIEMKSIGDIARVTYEMVK
jgi:acyl carrier protein